MIVDVWGGNSLSSEEQPNGSSCAKSPSKISVPSSMPQAPVCLSNTTQTSNTDSSPVMHSLPSTTSVATQNLNSQRTDSPGEDAASQTTDSSVDISSPRNGIKRPALSPVRPTINKVSLIEQQLRTDQAGALNPDVHTPFSGKADACKRLVRYHVLNERVLSARDLDKADEIFEATARHLLDKFSQMTAKYRYLLLMESMKEVRTSELMMIDRMFVAEEQLALERLKEEAQMEKKKTEEESKSEENANGLEEANPNPSASVPQASSETSLKEVRINLHDVLKSEAIKKEPEEGRYTIVRNPIPVVKEEEVRPEEEKPYDEWEAIQKELSVYCGVKREEGSREEHPPNGEPGARQLPAGEESSCDASRSPGLGGPAPPLDDPGGGNLGENSNLCEDDDINAQVQSAIDSILNLQRAEDEGLGLEDVFDVTLEEEEEEEEQPQRRTVDTGGNRGGISRATCEVEDTDALSKEEVGGGDLALDEAVRSILSS
ncbi:hypothetical protein J437_LFUL006340 [Ladona fulva]|uniref:GLTSCR protein conserved domain-containing protein n=1 Tax=Ladona fulva TaxID=123851 RepID=A0A8K0K1G1_LADFU|nr:hypothetical protein J437_LFUL006340 [Ladona fulva]